MPTPLITVAALYVERGGMRERFFAKTMRDDASGCLLWTASVDRKGYGQFSIAAGRPAGAHRVAWTLAFGRWPELCVLHRCDNPGCVEITHLFEGTIADNNADMDAKGRARRVPPRPERAGGVKLTWDAVREIRSSTESGPMLATRFGVSRHAISLIRLGKTWREVQ